MKPRIESFLLFFCLSAFPLRFTAQDIIDSLQKILLTQKNDTNKVNTLNDLAWEYSFKDIARADSFSRAALDLSSRLKFTKGRSSAYNTLGLVCLDQNKAVEAIRYFKLSIADKEALGQKKGKATVLCNLGIAYKIMGKFREATDVYEQSLKLRIDLGDLKGQSDCYNNLGNVYSDMGELTKAMKYFENAVELRIKTKDYMGLAEAYNNIGGIYESRGEYQQQLDYMFKAVKWLDSLKAYIQLAVVYANISRVNRSLKNYDNAMLYALKSAELSKRVNSESNLFGAYICIADVYFLGKTNNKKAYEYYKLALELIEKGNNKFYQSYCYNGIGMCLENEGKINDAGKAFEKGLEVAREYGNKREILNSLGNTARFYNLYRPDKNILALLDEAMEIAEKEGYGDLLKKVYRQYAWYYARVAKKPESAIPYYEWCVEMNDSLFSDDVKSTFAQLQIKYETQKKDAEINILKQADTIKTLQLQEEVLSVQKRNYALISLVLLILLVTTAGYFYLQNQKIKHNRIKEQAIREAEEQERLRLAKDIHDDFGSGLSKIRFLGELIASQSRNNSEIQSGVRSISEVSAGLVDNMRDLVWALDPENTSIDNLIARVREYSSDYLEDLGIPLTITVEGKIPATKITKEAHRHIFFIIKEALQNIVKHSGCKQVDLEIRFHNNKLEFIVSDNGKGINPQNSGGNGLRNMKHRAGLTGAELDIKSRELGGTKLTLKVDVNNLIRK